MIKKIFLIVATGLVTISAWAQATPPGTISRAPTGSTVTNQITTGNAFTNRSGATYSTEQLASQLQSLRSVVDQTLPAVMAFTETASNSATSGRSSIAGTFSQILSGVLNRNTNQTTSAPAGGISSQGTNVVGILQGLLTTNVPGSTAVNAEALRNLASLQAELQNVSATLQKLNVGGSTNFGGGLTPTGR